LFRTSFEAGADRGIGTFVNLTDKQRELLELLVAHHESNGGAEFDFVCSVAGCRIT
jgi:hypothetical protein